MEIFRKLGWLFKEEKKSCIIGIYGGVGVLMLGLLAGLLSACTTPSSEGVTLVKAKAELTNDKSEVGSIVLQEGERAGEEVVPTALMYTVLLQNTGKQPLGKAEEGKEIRVKLVPHKPLVKVSEKVMGFNLFGPEEIGRPGLGSGESYHAVMEPNEICEYNLHFDVGYEEGPPEVVPLPSKDDLTLLKTHALDATIEVWLGDERIAQFDLTKIEK